jgi:GNAT superfamily N-acetyltransferase
MTADDVRFAAAGDAGVVARLLHDFNTEFDSPSPGVEVLTGRLERLLGTGVTWALLAGEPACGVALVTLRTNVWFDGPVALLDELYVAPARRGRGLGGAMIATLLERARAEGVGLVEINVDEGDADARRFYERHRFTAQEPTTGEGALYYRREP